MKLQEVLKVCSDFIENPENEENTKKYNDMLKNLVIRTYLPIQEKTIALVRMVLDSDKDIDVGAEFFTSGLELACCFDGLLSYVNIEPEVNLETKNYENYDLIYQSGLADYILEYCGKDYERLVRMLERTLSYENLLELTESMKQMDTGSLRELTNEIKNATKEVDPELVKNLADIMRMNDPNLYELKTMVEEQAADEAQKDIEK